MHRGPFSRAGQPALAGASKGRRRGLPEFGVPCAINLRRRLCRPSVLLLQ